MTLWKTAASLTLVATCATPSSAQNRTTTDGVYSLAQARRGAVHVPRCVTCHGDDLEGDLGPALVGPVYIARWAGRPLSDFVQRVITNFNGLAREGRDDEAGTVEQRAADFTAYVLLQNGFRSGPGELSPLADALTRVVIVEPARRR